MSIEIDTPLLPEAVTDAYFGNDRAEVRALNDGRVNQTFRATSNFRDLILQRLGTVIAVESNDDTLQLLNHMQAAGWEVPTVEPSRDGRLAFTDEDGQYWRALSYVPSDCAVPQQLDPQTSFAAGDILGRWHADLKSLAYQPVATIPHFHDTAYHVKKLETYQELLPNDATRVLAAKVLEQTATLDELPDDATQLIHGDPKLANMLFRAGKPFTLIDYDCLMRGSRWLDVGDLLRSTTGGMMHSGYKPEDIPVGEAIMGYVQGLGMTEGVSELQETAKLAAQRISLELAARYLNDTVEQAYFTWDNKAFETVAEHHAQRARVQIQVADLFGRHFALATKI